MRKLLTTVLAALLCLSTFAQSRTISGKVTDNKGNPIPGVSISVKNTNTGTTSSSDGSFSVTIPGNKKVLVFSSVGFNVYELTLGRDNTVSVQLTPSDINLEAVVVTGYSREKKSQFTGSASALSSKVVETVPVGAFDQALQGRAPGLLVNSGSGQPGGSANITIRGIQSVQGAGVQPLFVLDGIPIAAADMQSINPNDFESITVLKDAGAAALYGARGGTGVIVITTKKGKAGTTNFSYRTQYGFTQKPNFSNFNMMNTEEVLQYEERLGLAGQGVSGPGWAYSKLNPTYATQTLAVQRQRDSLLNVFRGIDNDHFDILLRNGFSQSHEFNLSGGVERSRYFLSASYFDQKGIDLNSRLRRYTVRFNLDQTVNKFSLQFNSMAGFGLTNNNEGDFRGNSFRNPFQVSWRAKPYETAFRADGTVKTGASTALNPTNVGNALEGLYNSNWDDRQIKIVSGLTLSYKILPFLTLKNTIGIDVASEFAQRSINANSYVGSLQNFNSGFNAEAYRIRTQLINTSALIYNNRFSNVHEVEVGGFFEVVRAYQKGLGFQLFNLDPRVTQTGQGAGSLTTTSGTYLQDATSAKNGFGIRSFFGTARYTYNNKYTVTGNIRRDGTSRILNADNKEINTWSAGFIWDAGKEEFIKKLNVLSDLKLRFSYGKVPNIGSIPVGNTIASGGYNINGGIYLLTNYLGPQVPSFGTSTAFAGSSISGLVPSTPGNPNLRIENIQKTNIGLDFSFWRNRARFTVDVYKNLTKDLFVNQPLSNTTGFGGTNLPINAGTMSNKGIELSANVDIVKSKTVDVTLGINHAINTNKIEDLGLVDEYVVGTFIIRKGLPYGTHFTQHYLGADPQTGRPLFETADGKTTTDPSLAPNFAKFGTFLPKHVGGFTLDVRYNNLSLSALFSYQFDVTRYNNTENWTTRGTAGFLNAVNANKIMLTEQWQKPGDNKYYQSPAFDRGFTSSDVHDAKFLRFRNINLSYTVSGTTIGSTKLFKTARFYVQGQNLWIWSPWRGLDPEDSNNISLNEYPNPRAVVFGLDLNF